jgi:nucleoside-diphosphate-sugar epimerase
MLLKHYIITGGAGFIGSHLTSALVNKGDRVIVIDNLSTGHLENLSDVMDDIKFIKGDIRDIEFLKKCFRGVEVVFHQAALPSVPRSIKDPIASNASNIDGTLNVLVAARDAGVKRVVCAASSSAYGDTEILPKTEEMPSNPLSPYAVTKYVGELYSRVFSRVYGLETVCLRYFNVFGPRQDPNSQYAAVIPKFIISMSKGESPHIYGDGEQSRDFTYIDNVVEANLLAAYAPSVSGEMFNIACGERNTINELVGKINEIFGTRIEPEYDSPRPGDVKHSMASIEKANKFLGYRPVVTFQEGLRRTVDWFKGK